MISRAVRRTTPRTTKTRSVTQSPNSSRPLSTPKRSKIRSLGKYQTILLILSLLFNCILLYWATEPYLHSNNPLVCPPGSYNPNSQNPCNPDYIATLLKNNPDLAKKVGLRGIESLNADHSSMKSESIKQRVRQSNRGIINPGSKRKDRKDTKDIAPNLNPNEYGNKQAYFNSLEVVTKALPASMSLLSDVSKRELSWISSLSRNSAPLIKYNRPNPELYITTGEKDIWFDNRFFVFADAKVAFCVMEKNSCTMFKQIFKRIRGKNDYLSTDYTKIHYLPYRGLADISFNSMDQLNDIMNNNDFYFAAFVREPLERLVSGYIDKCDKKRGVNLCDYARWSPYFKEKYGSWSNVKSAFTPEFDIWASGLFYCPCWPETDWHFAPQFNFCNLYQYVDKYDIFRFENRTHRQIWMERAGFWDKFGKEGWKSGGNDGVSIVDYGPKSHSITNPKGGSTKYIEMYAKSNPDIIALIIDHYRNDYIIFGIQMPEWMCDPSIPINDNVKRAMRTLPRTSRPPCDNYKWLWERE